MKAYAALIGAYCAVKLNAVSAVDTVLAPVVHPGHSENNATLRLNNPLKNSLSLIFGIFVYKRRY